jgi:DNA excision repair protein ERCC-2
LRIDWENRRWTGSVRECASYAPPGRRGSHQPQGLWRAEIGRRWHKTLQERESAAGRVDFLTEETIRGTLRWGEWSFELDGRIDQSWRESDGAKFLREVKTVHDRLPCPADDLRAAYPSHLHQLGLYRQLAQISGGPEIRAELLWVEITDGVIQRMPWEAEDETALENHLSAYVDFLESGRERRQKRAGAKLILPFSDWRPEQTSLISRIEEEALPPVLGLNAPPGFGKTAVALWDALGGLREGRWDKVVLATAKRSGQETFVRHLEAMLPAEGWRATVFPSQKICSPFCAFNACRESGRCRPPLPNTAPPPPWPPPSSIWKNGMLTAVESGQAAGKLGCCPYEFGFSTLGASDVWVLDLNYVFAARPRYFLESFPGVDLSRTALVVDEAHNLAERVASAWSFELNARDFSELSFRLSSLKGTARFRSLADAVADCLDSIPSEKEIGSTALADIHLALDNLRSAWESSPREWLDTLPPRLQDLLWSIGDLMTATEGGRDYFHYMKAPGNGEAICLDPAPRIGPVLEQFGRTFLMSGTLTPFPAFQRSCGLSDTNVKFLRGVSPWRAEAFTSAIDLSVDTRFRSRQTMFPKIARRIITCAAYWPEKPIAVFFSSAQMAETTAAYVETLEPGLRIIRQPKGLGSEEAEAFLEDCRFGYDLLFLILGSSLAESIDTLGGMVDTAILVGPGLPEPSPAQRARETRSGEPAEVVYDQFATIPAMRRINQAIGRLVRGPGDKARILLLCRRFAQPEFLHRLDPDLGSPTVIKSESDWENWLIAADLSPASE